METARDVGERTEQNYRLVPEQSCLGRARAQRSLSRVLCATIWKRGRRTLKVVVTGAAGLVGRATVSWFAARGDEVIGLTRDELDISDESAVRQTVGAQSPDVLV